MNLLDDQFREPIQAVSEIVGPAQLPGRDVVEDGLLGEIEANHLRHEGIDRLVVRHAGTNGVRQGHLAGAIRGEQAADADHRISTKCERIKKVVVDSAVQNVHALRPARRPHIHGVVLDKQVLAFDKLPLDLSFTRVKGNGARKLVIFSDADCPFCHRLENELKNLDNVTIYTFLFPIDQLHPDAARKSKQIWCAPDKVKAWDDFFASGKVPDNAGDCGDPVAKTQALGESMKINATPTLVFADGTIVPGALPLAQIEKQLADSEVEAKKLASAPKP